MNRNYLKIDKNKLSLLLLVILVCSSLIQSGCTRTEVNTDSVVNEVPFETIEKVDETLAPGERRVESVGENGFKRVTFEITTTDGKETDRKVVKEKVIKEPKDEIVLVGPPE